MARALCQNRERQRQIQRRQTEEKACATNITDKELISKTYKEFHKSIFIKGQTDNKKKLTKGLKQTLSKQERKKRTSNGRQKGRICKASRSHTVKHGDPGSCRNPDAVLRKVHSRPSNLPSANAN
jgi:hypothetical protein